MTHTPSKKDLRKAYWSALTDMQYGRAIAIYEKYAKKKRLSPKETADLGLFYDHRAPFRRVKALKKRDEARALALYKQLVTTQSGKIYGLNGIARIFWHRTDPKAILYYRKALPLYPKDKRWIGYQNLANAYFSLGYYRVAERCYSKALRAEGKGKGHGFYYNLAKFYYFTHEPKKTASYLRKALRLLERFRRVYGTTKEYLLTKETLIKMKDGTL